VLECSDRLLDRLDLGLACLFVHVCRAISVVYLLRAVIKFTIAGAVRCSG
jgi:hypothetical protein